MNAHPVLLQKKYTRIVEQFASKAGISLDEALSFFYHSEVYKLVSEGVSDMHCMSDGYLVEDLVGEYNLIEVNPKNTGWKNYYSSKINENR